MTLTFLVTVRDSEAVLWRSLQSLKAVLQPGDQLVLVDQASTDDSAALLARFGHWPGWGQDIGHEIVSVTAQRADEPGLWAGIAVARTRQDYCLCLEAGDLLEVGAVAGLRTFLQAGQPDLVICNHAQYLISPASTLACADADRWPDHRLDHGPNHRPDQEHEAAAVAGQLKPDLCRLVIGRALLSEVEPDLAGLAPWQAYAQIVTRARDLRLRPEVLRLTPLVRDMSDTRAAVADILPRVQAAAPDAQAPLVARLQADLADLIAGLDRDHLGDLAGLLTQVLAALPSGPRQSIMMQGGDVAAALTACQRGGEVGLAEQLGAAFATQDRLRLRALTQELQSLRRDIDSALPGPDYLIEMHERLRRV